MNKRLIALAAVMVLLTASGPISMAQEESDVVDQTQIVEESEDVGLLPTNPFYFLKEWSRGLRRAFILDPVEKAEFELEVADEKERELHRVSEIDEDDLFAVERASRNYEEAMERLRMRLEQVEENSENPNVQRLLGRVEERVEEHQRRIDAIADKFESARNLRDKVRDMVDNFERFVGPPIEEARREEILERVEETIGENRQRIETRLEGVNFGDFPDQVNKFRQKLEIKLEGRDDFRQRLRIENRDGRQEFRLRVEDRLDDDLDEEDEDEDLEEDEDGDDDDDSDDDRDNSGEGSVDDDL